MTFFNFSIFFFFQKFPKFKPIFAEKEEAQSISILNDFSLKLSLGIRTIWHRFQSHLAYFCKENVPIWSKLLLKTWKIQAISVFCGFSKENKSIYWKKAQSIYSFKKG